MCQDPCGRVVRYLVELSAEHPTLPRAELDALAAMAGGAVAEQDMSVALVDAPEDARALLLERPGLAHAVSAHWWSTAATPRAVVPPFGRIALKGERFAVRGRRVEGAHAEFPLSDTERAIGGLLAVSGKVDLRDPELVVRLVLAEDAHVGALLGEVDRKRLEARHVRHRAHFAPVSIHPRFARALVNLARIRPGDGVADPFCGTGGLVLEAALVGARVFAGDLDARMAEGTRATLERLGLAAEVAVCDVAELPRRAPRLDAVISDPPYGRSSTTNREDIRALYDRFFDAAHAALKPGGRLAFITASEELRDRAGARGFKHLGSHEQRVHRSMTRFWGVYEKVA